MLQEKSRTSAHPIDQIQKQSALNLHAEAMAVAARYKTCERELFEVITKIGERRIYRQFEIVSLFEYCVELLGLSRHTAYNFIDVVRTAKEVPALSEAIVSGRTTIAKEWIDLTIHCSTRVVEKAVAQANPRAAVQESMRYGSGEILELKMSVSEEWSDLLNDVKDLMSQRLGRAVTSEETLFLAMSEYKLKHDPVLKAERSLVRVGRLKKQDQPSRRNEVSSARTRHIPAKVMHLVNLRDQGQCTFVDRQGKQCGSKRWLQLHHLKHFADGGEHAPENLQTLCWAHHCMAHR